MSRHPADEGRAIINRRVGDEVRRLRLAKKMTLRELARTLGVSAPYMSDVEHGRRSIKARMAAISALLGVAPEHFAALAGFCSACSGTGVAAAKA